MLRFISCVYYTLHPGYPRNRCIFFVAFNDKSLWIWSSFYYLKIFHKYSLQQIEFLAFSNFIVIERQKCTIYIDWETEKSSQKNIVGAGRLLSRHRSAFSPDTQRSRFDEHRIELLLKILIEETIQDGVSTSTQHSWNFIISVEVV